MKRSIIIISISLALLFSPVLSNKAYAWKVVFDPAEFSNSIKDFIEFIAANGLESWENYFLQWEDVQSAGMKLGLTSLITDMINNYITTGNNGRPYYIQDWDDYVANEPINKSDQTVNTFFSDAGYTNIGYDKYRRDQYEQARQSAYSPPIKPAVEVKSFTENVSEDLLANPDNEFRPLQALLQPTEQPVISQQMLLDYQRDSFEANKEKNLNEQKDGNLPKKDVDGKVLTPATANESLLLNGLQMGNDIIVNSKNPYELGASVLTNWLTGTLSNGIGG